jgi:hypothetical protein
MRVVMDVQYVLQERLHISVKEHQARSRSQHKGEKGKGEGGGWRRRVPS